MIILCQAMRLIHPMAPFISEELFQLLKERLQGIKAVKGADDYTADAVKALQSESCIIAPYPQVIHESDINPSIDETFDIVDRIVYTIRNIRGEMKIHPSTATDVHILGLESDPLFSLVKENKNIVSALVRTNFIEMHTSAPHLGFASTGMLEGFKIMIPLPPEMLKQELTRLSKEKERLSSNLDKMKVQLSNPDFVNNAPKQLIEKQTSQLRQTEKELSEIVAKIESIGQ